MHWQRAPSRSSTSFCTAGLKLPLHDPAIHQYRLEHRDAVRGFLAANAGLGTSTRSSRNLYDFDTTFRSNLF